MPSPAKHRQSQTLATATVVHCACRAAAATGPSSAGLSVSELNAEITVETEIVKRKLPEELPHDATDERARHKHRAEHQADGDDRARHLLHRFDCRVARRQSVFNMMLDGFDHDDGIVDHDADRQHQAEQRQVI